MNRLPKIGSKVLGGGNIPILGQKKVDLTKIPRFSAEQMQEFLMNIAFTVTEQQAMNELKLKAIADEMGLELEVSEEDWQAAVKNLLPSVMASMGFLEGDEENEGPPDETT